MDGKERFIHEKSRVFSSESRAADLSALCRGLPALCLYFSKMEQTLQGSWMKILRRSYSSCFFTSSQASRVPTTAPRMQGDKQVSHSRAHSPTQDAKSQKTDQREQQPYGSAFTSIRITLQTLNTKAAPEVVAATGLRQEGPVYDKSRRGLGASV